MAAPVLVAKVETRDMPVEVAGIGTVEAYSTVSVKSLVSGALEQVAFREGQDVGKGALLFRIDSRPFQTDLDRARANLARNTAAKKQAEANLARDEADARNATVERQRYGTLFQKGVVAKEQFEQAQTRAEALDAALRADGAAVESASEALRADQAAIAAAELNLSYCQIHAPIAGRTGSLLVHEGNIVKSNDTTLVVINQVHPIFVQFAVPEQDLAAVRRSVAAGTVRIEAGIPNDSGPPANGTLAFIDNAVNPATGTIQLKGLFENKESKLWPGQFVNVTVTLSVQAKAVVIPSQAVQTGQSGTFVFVVKPDMTVELRPVAVSRIVGGLAVIEKGLSTGDTVVTDGQIRLAPGSPVQIKSAL